MRSNPVVFIRLFLCLIVLSAVLEERNGDYPFFEVYVKKKMRLAYELDIPAKHGFIKDLALALNISHSSLSNWIARGKIPIARLSEIEEKSVPLGQWYIEPETEAPPVYKQAGISPPETADGTQVAMGNQFMEDINHLKVIYDYGDPEIITAIHSNLKTFNRTVAREIEAKKLQRQVHILDKKCKQMEEENADLNRRVFGMEEKLDRVLYETNKKKAQNT